SGLNMATYRASQAAQASDDLGHVAGAAVGGLVSGLIAPRSDELAIKRPYQIQQAGMRAQAAAAANKEQREAALNEAEIDRKKATAHYYTYRPEAERQKTDAQALTRTQSALRSELKQRLQNPRPFDLSDPYDSDLQ